MPGSEEAVVQEPVMFSHVSVTVLHCLQPWQLVLGSQVTCAQRRTQTVECLLAKAG